MRSEGEVVLIYYQDLPVVYGRIDTIRPDAKRDWYQIHVTLLTIPVQYVTWILREAYIDGAAFTMGGVPMRLEAVSPDPPPKDDAEPVPAAPEAEAQERGPAKATVIPFRKPSKQG